MFGPRIYDLCRFSGNTNQPNRFVRSGRCTERSGRAWHPVRIFLLRGMKWQGEDSRLFAILRLVKRLPAILNPVPPLVRRVLAAVPRSCEPASEA